MGRRKKKNVVRCIICGVRATKNIAADVHVCANVTCEVAAWEGIEETIAVEKYLQKQEKGGAVNVPSD